MNRIFWFYHWCLFYWILIHHQILMFVFPPLVFIAYLQQTGWKKTHHKRNGSYTDMTFENGLFVAEYRMRCARP